MSENNMDPFKQWFIGESKSTFGTTDMLLITTRLIKFELEGARCSIGTNARKDRLFVEPGFWRIIIAIVIDHHSVWFSATQVGV